MKTDILSIAKTAERCKDEGIPLAEKALRRFVKLGDIPSIQTGKKALIYFPNVRHFVETGNNAKAPEQGQIRRVSE
jgi:hypothetical protein